MHDYEQVYSDTVVSIIITDLQLIVSTTLYCRAHASARLPTNVYLSSRSIHTCLIHMLATCSYYTYSLSQQKQIVDELQLYDYVSSHANTKNAVVLVGGY